MNYRFVTIEGTIGAGKTTLARKLAEHLGGSLLLEEFEQNPFLPKFYQEPERYAFSVELFFMAERFKQLQQLRAEPNSFASFTLSDFLFQKSLIFAEQTLHAEELKLYRVLFDLINPGIPKPDLIIYLFEPVENLLRHIQKRGRAYERNISATYLQQIQAAYFKYFEEQQAARVVILHAADMDWMERETDYEKIVQLLHEELPPGIHHR